MSFFSSSQYSLLSNKSNQNVQRHDTCKEQVSAILNTNANSAIIKLTEHKYNMYWLLKINMLPD
jgi:hypothetical protein